MLSLILAVDLPPSWVDPIITASVWIALIGVIVAAAISFLLPMGLGLLEEPKRLLKTGIGVGVILVLFLVGYGLSGNEVTELYKEFNVNAGISKFVGAMLALLYILGFLILVAILSSFVFNPSGLVRVGIGAAALGIAFLISFGLAKSLSYDSAMMPSYPNKVVTQLDNSVIVYDTFEDYVLSETTLSETGYKAVGGAFNLTTAFIILATVLPILFGLMRPLSLVRIFIAIAILAGIYGIAYSLAGSEVTRVYARFNVDASLSKFIGGGMIFAYILLGLAFVVSIASSFRKTFLNFG